MSSREIRIATRKSALALWQAEYVKARLEQAQLRTGGPLGLLKWSVHTWIDYAASSYTIILVMECVAFMLLGMALFKLGVLSGARSLRFYLLLMAAGYAAGLTINGAQAASLFDRLEASGKCFVVIAPNNDPGTEDIFAVLERLPKERFRLIPSMRFNYFSELMKHAAVMVGNSSAGVREA